MKKLISISDHIPQRKKIHKRCCILVPSCTLEKRTSHHIFYSGKNLCEWHWTPPIYIYITIYSRLIEKQLVMCFDSSCDFLITTCFWCLSVYYKDTKQIHKIWVGGKKFRWEEKKIQYFCVLSRNFSFPLKILPFYCKDICVLSQNQLSLHKHFLFTLQLVVVHTAPSIQQFIYFYFELGLKYK